MKLIKFIPLILVIANLLFAQTIPDSTKKSADTTNAITAFIDSSTIIKDITKSVDSVIKPLTFEAKEQKNDTIFIKTKDKPTVSKAAKEKKEIINFFNLVDISIFTILRILILILIGYGLYKLVDKLLTRRKPRPQIKLLSSIAYILKVIIFVITVYLVITQMVHDSDFILLIVLLIGLFIIGLSTLPFFTNLIGGLYLSVNSPFKVDDSIQILDFEGEVKNINWRSTEIVTADNNNVSIPNSLFLRNPLININRGEKEQLIKLKFQYSIDREPDDIIKLLYEAALSSPYLHTKTEPKVFLIENNFIKEIRVYELHLYIIDIKYENLMKHSLNLAIAKNFKDENK